MKRDGFTLLEVLIALVIVGIVFPVIADVFISVMKSYTSNYQKTNIAAFAASKLDEASDKIETTMHGYENIDGVEAEWGIDMISYAADYDTLRITILWNNKQNSFVLESLVSK